MRNKKRKNSSLILIICTNIIFLLVSCSKPAEITIGMIVSETGKYSPVLTTSRNGAFLAAEEINEMGELSITFVVKDDESDIAVTQKKAEELKNEEVSLVLGLITSEAYASIEEYISRNDMLMLSSTASSDSFSRKDDFFFRTTPDTRSFANALAVLSKEKGITSMTIVFDENNQAYSEAVIKEFTSEYQKGNSERTIDIIAFNSSQSPSFIDISSEIRDLENQGLLIIASSFDASLICQHISDEHYFRITVPWAISEELVKTGGNSVEGMFFYQAVGPDNNSKKYLDFKARYFNRFGKEPTYQSVSTYDTIHLLYNALLKTDDYSPDGIKRALLQNPVYQGLQGSYTIDEYGDCTRKLYLYRIWDGEFEMINN